jgi:hypothetical protein
MSQFRKESEKIAARLAERFEAANTTLREDIHAELQFEIRSPYDRRFKKRECEDINNFYLVA